MTKLTGFKKTKRTISLADVKFETLSYPREKPSTKTREQYTDAIRAGSEFPIIELDANGMVLLDGYHRWKAHGDAGSERIEVLLVELDGTPRLLYAAMANAKHGLRMTSSEMKEVARKMTRQQVGQELIKDALQVSLGMVNAWVKDITEARRRERDAKVWWLGLMGWTQEEIGEHVGETGQWAGKILKQFSELKIVSISQHTRGRSIAEVAESEGVPDKLVEVAMLDGKDDAKRMAEMEIGVKPFDVWTFTGCEPRFGEDWPGRIPGELVLQLLYFFTKPGDVIVDPMVGSGTTIDACCYLGRKVYGYDMNPCEGRFDIIKHNIATDGWPDRVKKARLVFWDPPYFKKKAKEYAVGSVSDLDRKQYLEFFSEQTTKLKEQSKANLAFLCSDFDDEGGDVFFWDYVSIFVKAGWTPKRRVQVPLTTQQIHPDIVNKFRDQRKLARLGRDLLILE